MQTSQFGDTHAQVVRGVIIRCKHESVTSGCAGASSLTQLAHQRDVMCAVCDVIIVVRSHCDVMFVVLCPCFHGAYEQDSF